MRTLSRVTRREFLRTAGLGLGALALRPSLLCAQSPSGVGKNLVVINLQGGLDGLAAFPFFAGPLVSVVNSELRPTIGINPAQVIPCGGQGGMPNRIGFHPAFQPLTQVASGKIRIVQGYGIPGEPGRSHDTCQILMSLGASRMTGGDMTGFMARLMDLQNWETLQYWALGSVNAPDVNTRKKPPVSIYDLASFDYPSLGWEGARDLQLAIEAQQDLVEVQVPNTPAGDRYKATLSSMHRTLARVRRDISGQSVGNNSAGNYDQDGIGGSLRDAAKILKSKTAPGSDIAAKDTLILMSQGGYDTHSDQNNPDPESGGLAGTLGALARNLAVFYRDLEANGLLSRTVVVVYSEFGRTCYQNGTPGSPSVGTDHGHGSNTLIFGGPIVEGVTGEAPSATDLRDEYDALPARIDYRDIFSDVLRWVGVDPRAVFDDPTYTPGVLGLLSA